MDDNYINKLIDDIQQERTKLFNELKSDTELAHTNFISSKLTTIDVMFKAVIKLRNITIKEKLKCDL